MENDRKLVKLIEVNEFKDDLKKIEEYCDFISKTLFKLSKKESVYLEDIKKCIDRADRIRSYASFKASGDDHLAFTSFVFDEN